MVALINSEGRCFKHHYAHTTCVITALQFRTLTEAT